MGGIHLEASGVAFTFSLGYDDVRVGVIRWWQWYSINIAYYILIPVKNFQKLSLKHSCIQNIVF